MAQNISGLFNYDSPEAIQTNYLNTLAARRPRGGGDLYSQLANAGGNIGGLLGYTLGGLAGYKPAGMQKAETMDQIMAEAAKGDNPLAQAKKAYELFASNGMGREAQVAMERVTELQKEQDALKQTADLANVDFSKSASVLEAAKAALRSGDREGGVALLKEFQQLKQEEAKLAERNAVIERRKLGIKAKNKNMPEDVLNLVSQDEVVYKKWADTLFEAEDKNYDLSYQTFDGQRVMRLVDKDTGNLVKEVTLGKAAQTAPSVKVTVDQKGIGEYAKIVGSKVAEKDVSMVTVAETAAESMPKLEDTLAVLRKEKDGPITGIGAEIILNFERVKAKFLKDKGSIDKVKSTELLDAFLGSEVFPMITALGIGARGLDTVPEREFLRAVFTGTIAMNKETLIEMTEIRQRIAQRAIDKYNKKLSEGYFENYEKAQGREMKPITFGSATISNWEP